ncbi:MAG: arginine decarboxylase, pyruvoyl-dependent, partial [Desulfotomaculaceae bacterium]|nr:arginine decarboxylase, pyruvoyl-dependent [Desulfotomaculaceae bacterium]
FFVTAGSAEGKNPLHAFANALLKSRIGNLNLLRVTCILPPGVVYCPDLEIPPGSLVPTAYGYIISDVPGQQISAAVGVGFSQDSFGIIMEFSGKCSSADAERAIERMLQEAFAARNMELAGTKIAATEHRVEKIACALAAVPLWY